VAPHGDGFSFERPRTAGQIALALDCFYQIFEVCYFDMPYCVSLLGGPLILFTYCWQLPENCKKLCFYMFGK
jgi:hypothetical protein